MSSQRRNNKGKKSNNNKKSRTRMMNHPRQIQSNIEIVHRYRYTSTSAARTIITGASLAGAVGNICTVTNTAVVSIAQSFKLLELEIFSPPSAQGSSSTCSVEWLGGTGNNYGPSVEISDTSNSVSTPAHVRTGPPANSNAAFWQLPLNTNNNIAAIIAPVGSIIDCVIKFILTDEPAFGVATAVATAVQGDQYYLSLDPNATHNYTPVSLTTTT